MTATAETNVTTQVYQVYIRATPEAIWDAITKPEWTQKYGYAARVEYELRQGGAFRAFATPAMADHGAPDVIIQGEILESDPPRRLVQTWHPLFDADLVAEGPSRLTYELEPLGDVTKLTLIHDVEGTPRTATLVSGAVPDAGGGWPYVLSDLKTLLETGDRLPG